MSTVTGRKQQLIKKLRDQGLKTRGPDGLTPREREAVEHARSGFTIAEIAQIMRVSRNRVYILLRHAVKHNSQLKELSDWVLGITGIHYTPGGPASEELLEHRRYVAHKPDAEPKPFQCRICGETNPAEFYTINKSLCKTCKVAQARIQRHAQR